MDDHVDPKPVCRAGTVFLPLLATLVFLILTAGLRVAYLINDCPLDLSGDEAHYWEWSRRLDLSYYSKGPLVAYIIAGSTALLADLSNRLVGSEMLAVRAPAVALSILSGLGIFTLAVVTTRRGWIGFAAVTLTATMPILAVGSSLMTIDAPYTCLWVWTLVAAWWAVQTNHPPAWLITGLLIGLGILAKYTMLLILPTVGLFILIEPSLRYLARRPGPYAATLVGLIAGLAPIIAWNARHNWVSFRHVGGQAGVSGETSFDLLGPLAYIAGQAVIVNAVWFGVIWWAMVRYLQAPKAERVLPSGTGVRYLVIATVAPWAAFLVFSPITKIQPNWPVVALMSGSIVLALALVRLLSIIEPRSKKQARLVVGTGVGVGLIVVVLSHNTHWLTPLFGFLARNAPSWELTPAAKYDPSARLRGWSELGHAVGDVLAEQRAAGRDPFIMADHYQTASEIAFYCPAHPTVYCAQAALGDRLSQYDLWTNPIDDRKRFVGRPCIYIGSLKPELYEPSEDKPPPLPGLERAEVVKHRVGGLMYRVWPISVCPSFAGFDASWTSGATAY